MLRRTCIPRISAYEFGHPTMNSAFSKEVYPSAKPQFHDVVKRSTLNNGMKVVTQDRKGQMTSVGFFVEAGAKYDPMSAPGLSYVMRWAALTSNSAESLFQIDRAMRAVGASYGNVEVNKKYLGFVSEVQREHWKVPVEKMQSCFVVPRFAESDVERFRDTMDNQLEETRWQNPREYCELMLETVAFHKEPLGNCRMVLPQDNDSCSSGELMKQYCSLFTPQRFTIAGINIDHAELVSYYSTLPYQLSSSAPHFNNAITAASPITDESSQYYGLKEGVKSENRCGAMGTHPHQEEDGTFAVGWLTNGAEDTIRKYATSLVVRGLFDSMFADTLRPNRNAVHFGHRTFYRPYSTAGLVGVTFRAPIDTRLTEEYKKVVGCLPAKVAQPEVAKGISHATLSYYTSNLENQRDVLATLATSAYEPEAVLNEIGKVTVDDVNTALTSMKKNKPVAFSTGLTHDFPSLRSLAPQLNLLN